MSVGQDLLAAPFPQIIRNLGVGIAEAQLELDLVSVKIARLMAGYAITEEDAAEEKKANNNQEVERPYLVKFADGNEYSLLELGFTPTFYQFVDTVIELKMSVTMSTERTTSRSRKSTTVKGGGVALPFFAAGAVKATSVSASFSSKYQYSAEASSMVRTKLVPVPAPAILEERIRALITPADDDGN
ncbi:MAG: hypothetical protein AAGF71_01400 [Pseudomonadota bacterium]